MNKIFNSEEWRIDTQFPQHSRNAEISVFFKAPELSVIANLNLTERRNFVIRDRKNKLTELLATGHFQKYELIGPEQNPIGLRCKISFTKIQSLKRHKAIGPGGIIIHKLEGARRVRKKPVYSYYCMKVTAVQEIDHHEDETEQVVEERFVLIRAKSFEDAYKRMKKHEKTSCEPYMNSSFEIVRWKIIDYEDCFLTDIHSFNDLSDSNGKVVYSLLERKHFQSPSRLSD